MTFIRWGQSIKQRRQNADHARSNAPIFDGSYVATTYGLTRIENER